MKTLKTIDIKEIAYWNYKKGSTFFTALMVINKNTEEENVFIFPYQCSDQWILLQQYLDRLQEEGYIDNNERFLSKYCLLYNIALCYKTF